MTASRRGTGHEEQARGKSRLADHLTPADRAAGGDHVGCIAGALTFAEYRNHLTAAGFVDTITPTHQLTDGMHSAIVKAAKPAT